jgi:hypothetical protein
MKKFSMLLTLAAFIIGGTIFNSCQKEETQQTPEKKVENMLKATEPCVAIFAASNAEIVYTNDYFNVTVTAWNDLNNTYFTITRTGGNMTVRYASPGQELTQTTAGTILDAGTTVTTTVANPIGWKCGDPVTISYYVSGLGGGNPNTFQSGVITFNLRCLCGGCETEFFGKTECGEFGESGEYNRKAVYTFITEEGTFKIQGGLTNFTGMEYSVNTTVGSITTNVPGGSSNLMVTAQGTLANCQEVVVTVYWYSTNSADFIVGDWSVELDGVKILEIDKLECNDEGEGYLPVVE